MRQFADTGRIKKVLVFANGNVAVFGGEGNELLQMPKFQGEPWSIGRFAIESEIADYRDQVEITFQGVRRIAKADA